MKKGIVVGSDRNQEWLLPWWWKQYRKTNDFPVVFADFGLSTEMKKWCSERGDLISLPPFFADESWEVSPGKAKEWEAKYGENFWSSRSGWFNKPFACLASPFDGSIWIDLDCEVLGSLEKLFDFGVNGMALAKDAFVPDSFNTGVIVFSKETPLMFDWARRSKAENGRFRSDQDLLSHLIAEKSSPIEELPSIYNWPVGCGENPEVVICHWIGETAKKYLRENL